MDVPPLPTSPHDLVELLGTYPKAVDALAEINRALWRLLYPTPPSPHSAVSFSDLNCQVELRALENGLPEAVKRHLPLVIENLKSAKEVSETADGRVQIPLELVRTPFSLARVLLRDLRPDHELRYFVMRNMRRHYQCLRDSTTIHRFQFLARAFNCLCAAILETNQPPSGRPALDFCEEFYIPLCSALRQDVGPEVEHKNVIDLFTECSRAVNYISSYFRRELKVRVNTTVFDAEYMLGYLFGIPSGIQGFDDLFGGGGLILTEDSWKSAVRPEASLTLAGEHSTGRAIVIKGCFATGKTLLSLQLAAEVASKGGIAWVTALEQSAEECKCALEAIQALPDERVARVATSPAAAAECLAPVDGDDRGALIILGGLSDSFENFCQAFVHDAMLTTVRKAYPLRLITVDPVNSIQREHTPISRIRSELLQAIKQVTKAGTNAILVSEEGTDPENQTWFEENIADTVIHLSVDRQQPYFRRYFEITKSRLQREHRGKHPLYIKSGTGVSIYPSPASVRSRIREREIRPRHETVRFGVESLDQALGGEALSRGDVIALRGPGGSFKTILGMQFLVEDAKPNDISLLFSARDTQESVIRTFKNRVLDFLDPARRERGRNSVRICQLPHGNVDPGIVLHLVEDEFIKARQTGKRVNRLMIDNIGHWDLISPFIRRDETFADTLVELLRHQEGLTSLLICGDLSPETVSPVQRTIIGSANSVIQFERFEFRGSRRVCLRILKTRGMLHSGQPLEIGFGSRGVEVKPGSSLLRFGPGGDAKSVSIRLFLHSESEAQEKYNETVKTAFSSVVSRNTEIESQDRMYLSRAMSLGHTSAVDELQLIQLDEFQLPDPRDTRGSTPMLHRFDLDLWDEASWGAREIENCDFVKRLVPCFRDAEAFVAVPFYANPSLMAYRQNRIKQKDLHTWRDLVKLCQQWENSREAQEPSALFFEYPRGSNDENYNCFFLEILLSLIPAPPLNGQCSLAQWISHPKAIEAGNIFWRLGRRAYRIDPARNQLAGESRTDEPIIVSQNALVWRHWYSTLNQMMHMCAASKADIRKHLKVMALPAGISVAGEWFLGVPSYSAAPDVGLEMIRLLTPHVAELSRLQRGVGLPTRQSFYSTRGKSKSIDISPLFSAPASVVRRLVEEGFQRSRFSTYRQFSSTLAHNLRRILEIPDSQERTLERRIQQILNDMQSEMKFAGPAGFLHQDQSTGSK